MAPDTTRKAVNLAAADARRAIEALQEQSTSLQRELAEARAERDRWRAAVRDYVHGDAVAFCPPSSLLDAAMQSAPGPSDAKGEARKFTTPTEPEMREYKVTVGPSPGGNYTAEVFGAGGGKSRPSLTPLTDPTVRGVLVDDGEPRPLVHLDLFLNSAGELQQWASYTQSQAKYQPVRLRPASEFGVPADPAQKLVPLEPGMIVGRKLHDLLTLGANVIRYKGDAYEPVDPTLYGVDAERAWDQTELHKAQCESIGLRAEVERQSERIASLTSAAETAEAEAERLRKAIEEALHAQQHRGLKVAREILQAALTPPTAASGEPAMECLDKIGEAMTASAPAAESEGGDGD